jgi:hypothetical protein
MQVSLTRRFANRLEFGAAWTWSKATDFVDTDTAAVSTLVSPRVWNYGLAGFDRTHVVKINWLYNLPGSGLKMKPARYVLGNWQINGIASFISGAPLGVTATTTTGADITGSPTDPLTRPDVTGKAVLAKSDRTVYKYFETSVFLPVIGTTGNQAKTVFRGPGVNNFDISLLKTIPIYHRARVEFRAEAYNAFNHTQYTTLDTTARFNPANGAQTNDMFGQVTAAGASG